MRMESILDYIVCDLEGSEKTLCRRLESSLIDKPLQTGEALINCMLQLLALTISNRKRQKYILVLCLLVWVGTNIIGNSLYVAEGLQRPPPSTESTKPIFPENEPRSFCFKIKYPPTIKHRRILYHK